MRDRAKITVAALMAFGVFNWVFVFDRKDWGREEILAVLAAIACAYFPLLRTTTDRLVVFINEKLRPHKIWAAAGATCIAAVYLLWIAYLGRDNLFIRVHDEHSYMIQARMLSHFRLWMPAYPPSISPFFDGFSLIVDRVYASMYFPGTALLMVPGLWIGLPFWVTPLIEAALVAGLLYLVIEGLFTPGEAVLAVALLLAVRAFRDSSVQVLSESPFLLGEMVMLLGWFQFRRSPRAGWAMLIGAAAGFAAITRPMDAACFALPIGLAMCVQVYRSKLSWLRVMFAIGCGAAPMLALQAVQNVGVTGRWQTFPESYYNRENFPASPLGFHSVDLNHIEQPENPAKRAYLNQWLIEKYRDHTPAKAVRIFYPQTLRNMLSDGLCNLILIVPLVVGLVALRDLRMRILVLCAMVFVIAYAFYLFAIAHYVIGIIPTLICLVLLGCGTLARFLPGSRFSRLPYLVVGALALASIYEGALPPAPDESIAHDQRPANRLLPLLARQPAVVLFHFNPDHSQFHDDPVYNDDVEFPDQAKVIRAWDLGEAQNAKLFKYYADREPERVFYLYDPLLRFQKKYPIVGPLGTARELAERYPVLPVPLTEKVP